MKKKNGFVCKTCGVVYQRWQGQCDACDAWNTIEEGQATPVTAPVGKNARIGKGTTFPWQTLAQNTARPPRFSSGMKEVDLVLGGGFVPGSVILVGGEPGVGKSTLLIQIAAALANASQTVAYVSGEESTEQIRLRAQRLDLERAPVRLAAQTSVEDVLATLAETPPSLVIIDSIQTMWTDAVDGAPGTLTQVRACAQAFVHFAKTSDSVMILVGHVTKDGQIAGPRVVEHMVDAVLSFEGDESRHFRILRGVKNRFGATDEIGVFEMTAQGLKEVSNPSRLFLAGRDPEQPGAAVFCGVEGTRPVLCEIQALAAASPPGSPRRSVLGWDANRLAMILAVLENRAGVDMTRNDVYLNVAGGLRIAEPAADLAVAAALLSSFTGRPLPPSAAFFGEISLSGTIRPVSFNALRIREAFKLGFTKIFISSSGSESLDAGATHVTTLSQASDLVAVIAPEKKNQGKNKNFTQSL